MDTPPSASTPDQAPPAQGPLAGRHIVLGVSGSIAAFKAAEITSLLVRAGATVDVALTRSAPQFIGAHTFRGLTGRRPYASIFDLEVAEGEAHVELARRADLLLVAPATAATLARLAHGLAEDMVTLTALATRAPLLVAPAMDTQMWEAAATQENRRLLESRAVEFVGPVAGRLASGRSGGGRMAEPEAIVAQVRARLGREHGDLAGRRVVVSAGGTREPLDPVRYLGNRSSGKMGQAVAEAARDRGAEVVLVTTVAAHRSAFAAGSGVRVVPVETALEMQAALAEHTAGIDCLVMAAAVADYRPGSAADRKIKRAGHAPPAVELVENPDIIAAIPSGPAGVAVKVAFAAETNDLIENAERKLVSKDAHLLVANDVTAPDAGFGTETNRCTILDRDGGREELPLLSKYAVAARLLDRVTALLPPSGA